MSDRAKQLADQVNKRQAEEQVKLETQQVKERLQLHKAGILKSKGHAFWNNLAIVFREEVNDFNKSLTGAQYQIEFDDTTIYSIKLHAASGTHAECKVDLDAQSISLTGARSGQSLDKTFGLTVDNNDTIRIETDNESITESDIAIEVLKFLCGIDFH